MPELNPSPKFPITEKPRLSPNPKSTLEYKDGGRGTPVIVNTPPQPSIDPTEESAEIENLQNQINGKQDKLTFDSAPTQNSTNPVTSGGVYNALQNVGGEDIVTITATGVQSDEMDLKIKAAKAVYYNGKMYIKYEESATKITFVSNYQQTTRDNLFKIEYTLSNKYVTFTNTSLNRVASLGGSSNSGDIGVDNSLEVASSNLKLTGKLPYLTTLPSTDNTSGFLTIVKCTSEPAQADRREGYLYIVVTSA